MPKQYPVEFRRRVLDLLNEGRRAVDVAHDVELPPQTIGRSQRERVSFTLAGCGHWSERFARALIIENRRRRVGGPEFEVLRGVW